MAEPSAPTTPVSRTGTHLSIGEVLALLLEEFPDVTISKIRFLESQGLIDPERTASGYRKFYSDDVELLRCILREQRENYLPLRVIKDRIDSGEIDPTGEQTRPEAPPRGIKNVGAHDASLPAHTPASRPDVHPSAGHHAHGAAALFQRTDSPPNSDHRPPTHNAAPVPPLRPAAGNSSPAPTAAAPSTSTTGGAADSNGAPVPAASPPAASASASVGAVLPGLLLNADELCAMAGLTRDQLDDLQTYGVLVAHSGRTEGPFDEDAVEIATISKGFLDAGIEPRHLRGWRVAADREVGLLEQLIQPLLRQRNPESRAHAIAQLNELEQSGGRLRHAMMRSALREHGVS